MRDVRELQYFQSMPLDDKIIKTQQLIQGWYERYDGQIYVSFSGGKDSRVLLDLVRDLYPSVEAVFVDTGLEFNEIRKFAQSFENVTTIYPEMRFNDVIKEYGYPILSKTISHNVRCARNEPNGRIVQNCFNPEKKGPYAMYKWTPLRFVDFNIDDRCCDVMKKAPAHKYSELTGKKSMTAEMAVESRQRRDKWVEHGCNGFDMEYPKSTPMIFWTEQDVLEYIYKKNLSICSVYGDVVCEPEQLTFGGKWQTTYHTTGMQRTGCVFCGFGAHLESDRKRFLQLKEIDRKKYDYCFSGGEFVNGIWQPNQKGLGMQYVYDQLNGIYGENFVIYK